MGIEDSPAPELPSPDEPEASSFQSIESIFDLNPEAGSTFTFMSKDGSRPLETGMINNIVEDENFVGGGYFELNLTNTQTNELRSGKLAFGKFLDSYNNQRLANFLNPAPQEESHGMDKLTKRPLPASDAELLQRSRSAEARQGQIPPEFTSYLGVLIDRFGTDTVKAVSAKMTEADKRALRSRLEMGNLPGFTHIME
ncbi:MAG: hypothetical protein HYZ63_01395, partial [Candidatus Andersenbacteria bacterium]|nr:hypothetical protein [Candidatus Andersenbacteria bacterium]